MSTSDLKTLFSYRSIIWAFALVDLKLRYKNSVLGFFWSVLEPLLMLGVLYFVFTYVFSSQIVHYPLYLLLGIIIWNFFVRGTVMGMNSMIARSGLVVTVFFPRITLPISASITSLLMMSLELVIFALFMVIFQVVPTITIAIFPLLIVFLLLLTIGLSLPLCILNVKYRDVAYIWQILTYAGFFLSPIIYELNIFPVETQNVLLLNPLTQIINMSHDVIIYGIVPKIYDVAYTAIFCVAVFIIGLITFQRKKKNVSDYL